MLINYIHDLILSIKNNFEISQIKGFKGNHLLYLNSNGKGSDFLALRANNPANTGLSGSIWNVSRKMLSSPKWHFGYLKYDLKNDIEDLSSVNPKTISFSKKSFFQPDKVIQWQNQGKIDILGKEIELEALIVNSQYRNSKIELVQRTAKEDYLEHFKKIMFHIKRGDIYELNYCVHWTASNASIDPYETYQKLNEITKAPFSCFLKRKNKYLLCGSPERFIKKEGSRIISQPIKGTIKRIQNLQQDDANQKELSTNQKERAENVMTTDVVRNDLSRIAEKQSVSVEELAQLHSFETVHHLVSTIKAEVKEGTTLKEIIKSTFPMASMTGAPKISAMKIIEEEEDFQRGLYSGSVGYIKPNGDFDFNVVIRSILYDDKKKKIDIPVGGAITIKSDPEREYDECLLKAEAMFQALK